MEFIYFTELKILNMNKVISHSILNHTVYYKIKNMKTLYLIAIAEEDL